MSRFLYITIFGCLAVLSAGCSAQKIDGPELTGIRIGDLAPIDQYQRLKSTVLKTINFSVYTFEVPTDNISRLEELWQLFVPYPKQLRFNNYSAFSANSFSVGLGQGPVLGKTLDLLQRAKARKIKATSLFLPHAEPYDLFVTRLFSKQTVSYSSADGSAENVTVGPGNIALRLKARKISGPGNLCKVEVLPVCVRLRSRLLSQLDAGKRYGEFGFASVGFDLKMRPGEFFILGPKKYSDERLALANLLFDIPGLKPAVRTFLFVCTTVTN